MTISATGAAGPPASIEVSGGDAQVATVGGAVAELPRFRVLDLLGNPVPGASVSFVASAAGSVSPSDATTDEDGFVVVDAWLLGAVAGPNTLTATVVGSEPALSAVVSASGVVGPASPFELVVVPLPDGSGFLVLFEPVQGATAYEFKLSPSDGAWQPQSETDAGDGATPRPLITVLGWQPGDVVEIWVRALVENDRGPSSESAVATIRAVDEKPDSTATVPPVDGRRPALRGEDGSISVTFDYEVRNNAGELGNVWIRALGVPEGYEVVEVVAPPGRGRVRVFSVYPNHWYWENANLVGDDVVSLRVMIRTVEVE